MGANFSCAMTFEPDISRNLVTALQTYPKETSTHLALSALSLLPTDISPTNESLRAAVQNIIGQDAELPEEFDNAIGEMYVFHLFILVIPIYRLH